MLRKNLAGRGLSQISLLWLVGGLVTTLALTPLMLVGPVSYQENIPVKADNKPTKAVQEAYGHLPMSFEPNAGQFDSQVQFMARGSGYSLFLTPGEAVFSLKRGEDKKPQVEKFSPPIPETQPTDSQPPLVLRMHAIDSNPFPQLIGQEELPGKVNYFIGNDSNKWHTDIPTYSQVKYQGLYPGVDMVYYGNQGQLEYDFVVAPGANPDQIRLGYEGLEQLRLNPLGELELQTAQGVVTQLPPLIYQEIDGQRQQIPGSYRLLDNRQVGFVLGDYNYARPLTIDPVLVYSTYLGGSGVDEGRAIAVDSSGNSYITGRTYSPNFPLQNPYQNILNSGPDIFVTKFNPTGDALVYSTYIGGLRNGIGFSIAVDNSGNVYLTGLTSSNDYPTQNPIQATFNGNFDVIVSKLGPGGNTLIYSTYLGGTNSEEGHGIVVDSNGYAYITGYTGSTTFPIQNPIQATKAGNTDVFIAKINPAGNSLVYSTYLGGTTDQRASGIVLDSAGNVYISGFTYSANFPMQSPFQSTLKGNSDAFLVKINSTGNTLLYSTFLGGSNFDNGIGIAIDISGKVYIAGETNSSDFPTQNPFQVSRRGPINIFISKLDLLNNSLVYSTYLGSSGQDTFGGFVIDSTGNAYVTGYTNLNDFPTQNPIQATMRGASDTFVSELNSVGNDLVFSTYLGGTNSEWGLAIAVDFDQNIYLTGLTFSSNFPTQSPFQSTLGGSQNAYLTKISPSGACPFTLTSSTDDGSGTNCGTLSYALKQAIIYSTPITITLPSQITFSGPMPVVTPTATITLAGICTDNNGRGTPGSKIIAGSGAGNNALNMTNNMVLSGVTVTGFSGYALNITGSNNTVSCSWLGTADGSTPAANGGGVRLAGSNNKLGLPNLPLSGNLISGNSGLGLQVENGSKNNTAYYNLIGYTADGSGSLRNGGGGVKVLSGGQLKFGLGNKVR